MTHKHLPRRTFVKGLGVAIGLPFLDAMTPAFARAAVSVSVIRCDISTLPAATAEGHAALIAHPAGTTTVPEAPAA